MYLLLAYKLYVTYYYELIYYDYVMFQYLHVYCYYMNGPAYTYITIYPNITVK